MFRPWSLRMYSRQRGQTLWLIRRTHGSVEAGWDSTGVSPGCCIKILKYRTNEHHFEVIFFRQKHGSMVFDL